MGKSTKSKTVTTIKPIAALSMVYGSALGIEPRHKFGYEPIPFIPAPPPADWIEDLFWRTMNYVPNTPRNGQVSGVHYCLSCGKPTTTGLHCR